MLGEVLDVVLRLLHPVTPFVTEALWTELTGGESIVVAPWPAVPAFHDPAAEAEVAALQELVTEVRRFRSDQGLRPGRRVPARITGLAGTLAGHEAEVRSLATLEPAGESFAATASLTAGSVTVDLDLSGVIDVAAERKRLEKDLAAAEKERAQAQGKLGNAQFLAKAPAEVVDKIRVRLEAAEADLARITAQLAALPAA